MERIRALNRENNETTCAAATDAATENEKNIEALNEQYSLALIAHGTAKRNNQYAYAIGLFREILQNELLKQIDTKSQNGPVATLKYCCLKNLAELHEQDQSNVALEYFLMAREIDDTDIYFMNKFGLIALRRNQLELASSAFRRCLQLNPDHFPSIDGVLRYLCAREDYWEAFEWAVFAHSEFPRYQQAIDVILDVCDLLNDSPLLKEAFISKGLNYDMYRRSTEPSLFPCNNNNNVIQCKECVTDFNQFKIAMPSFPSVGHMIKSIHKESAQVTFYLTTKISLSDICDMSDYENDCTVEANKPNLQENIEIRTCTISTPTPIRDIFQEVLPQLFSTSLSMNLADDAIIQPTSIVRAIVQPNNYTEKTILSVDNQTFHKSADKYFCQFIGQLKTEPFNILSLICEWVKSVSRCSHIQLTAEMQALYMEIYEYHANFIGNWEQLPSYMLSDLIRMTVFYIELKIVANARANDGVTGFFDDQTMQKLYHILCVKAMFVDVCEPDLEVRLLLLHFQLGIEQQNIESAKEMLSEIEGIFAINSIEEIHLPNQFYCTKIDARIISNEKNLVDCLIFQKEVHLLLSFDEFPCEKFHEIETCILKCRQQHFEGKLLTALDQIEILIEGYWMTDRLIDCFRWCEIGLHHAVDTFWMYKTNKNLIPERHLQHIRFVWIYIQHLWKRNSLLIKCLGELSKRLICSIRDSLEIQCSETLVADHHHHHDEIQALFNADAFIEIFEMVLKNDQNLMPDSKPVVLNIIVRIAEWLILNISIRRPDDWIGKFLLCVWNNLSTSDHSAEFHFNRNEFTRLLSHSIFGYPKNVVEHSSGCTCKPNPIDWNGASLLLTSFEHLSNGMPESERKSLINDLLNTIPYSVQMNLVDAVNQLNDFLNDTTDFPHKCIPLKTFPIKLTAIFHCFANSEVQMPKYGQYTHEQLIAMDLVVNPKRFNSWLAMLKIKITQYDTIYNEIDLTKIKFTDMENLANAIENCFDRCKIFDSHENAASTLDYSWNYALHLYKSSKFFAKNGIPRPEFIDVHIAKRAPFDWKRAKKILISCLDTTTDLVWPLQQKFLCYYLLGKMAEIKKSIEYYLLAEKQLLLFENVEGDNDNALLMSKLEINYRITASIYKCANAQSIGTSVDEQSLSLLMQVLKRDKTQLFSSHQLNIQPPFDTVTTMDENANQIDIEQKNQVNEIIRLCARDFEWYLKLCPTNYKAKYYLVKISLYKDEDKCRTLLLQQSRKANEQENLTGLFVIHRCRNLFKVKHPHHLDTVHNLASFHKYMEKCVHIVIEYLAKKPNWYAQFVMALQFGKIMKDTASIHLKWHQKQSIFAKIFGNCMNLASNRVIRFNCTSAKTKVFTEFVTNVYELYVHCEPYIRSLDFVAYSKLLIECYRLSSDSKTHKQLDELNENEQFQRALDFFAKRLAKQAQAQAEKKKRTTKPSMVEKVNAPQNLT